VDTFWSFLGQVSRLSISTVTELISTGRLAVLRILGSIVVELVGTANKLGELSPVQHFF